MRTTTVPAAATAIPTLPTTAGLPHVVMLLHRPQPAKGITTINPTPHRAPRSLQARLALAKMSNSDRAKFYRKQHHERTRRLVQSVKALRRDVGQLALHTQLLRALVACGVVHGPVSDRIQTYMAAFLTSPRVAMPGFVPDTSVATRVTAAGDAEATVVLTRIELSGVYETASLEAVYWSIPGNSVLLDTLLHGRVRYQCVVRFTFGADGACEACVVDVDWVAALVGCVGRVADVAKVVGAIQALGEPRVGGEEGGSR